MATVSNTLTVGWASGSADAISQQVTLTANTKIIEAVTAVHAATTQHALAWTNASLQSIFIMSDMAVTLKTNSSGSPQDTIALAANKPFCWYAGCGITNPFVGNVTTSYWTNADPDNDATVQVRVLTNG